MILILLAIFILVLELVYQNIADNQKKYVWWLACFAMWFILAFRGHRVGSDTIQYVNGFERIINIPWGRIAVEYEKDTGFWYLAKLISLISGNSVWFVAVISFLSCIGVWVYIKNNTERPVLALFFFITLANFNFMITGMRQAVAMSVCLLSITFVEKRKFLPFFCLVLLAATFHKSALIFLLTYFVVRRKVDINNMLINILVVILVAFSYETLLGYVDDLLGYEYGVESLSNGYIFYAILLLIMGLAYFSYDTWLKDEKDVINMNMGIITTGMWTIRLFDRVIERPLMYWLNSIPVVLTNALDSYKHKREYVLIFYATIVIALGLFAKRNLDFNYFFCWQ